MNRLPVIDKMAARVLMVSFFLPMNVGGGAVIAVSLYFLVRVLISKEKVAVGNYKWAPLLGGSYLLYWLAVPLTGHEYRAMVLMLCSRKASLLLLPLIFATVGSSFKELIMRERMYFAYACFISCAVANAGFVWHFFISHTGQVALSHVVYRKYMEDFTGIHPTYMSMYLCFSICMLLLTNDGSRGVGKTIKYTLFYFMLAFLLAMLAKSPLIALGVIFLHYAWVRRKTLYRYKMVFAGGLVCVAAVYIFVPFFGQRIRELFAGDKSANVTENSIGVRKLIWDTDTGLLKHYWLTGTGPGRLLRALNERYFFYSLANNYNVGQYDPHSEYFYEWLSFGLLGIVVLFLVLAVHFWKAISTKNHLYLYLLIILCTTFFTESVLARQSGVLLYAVFTSLFFFVQSTTTKKPAAKKKS